MHLNLLVRTSYFFYFYDTHTVGTLSLYTDLDTAVQNHFLLTNIKNMICETLKQIIYHTENSIFFIFWFNSFFYFSVFNIIHSLIYQYMGINVLYQDDLPCNVLQRGNQPPQSYHQYINIYLAIYLRWTLLELVDPFPCFLHILGI